jgi:hypothetical protein
MVVLSRARPPSAPARRPEGCLVSAWCLPLLAFGIVDGLVGPGWQWMAAAPRSVKQGRDSRAGRYCLLPRIIQSRPVSAMQGVVVPEMRFYGITSSSSHGIFRQLHCGE